MFREREVSGPVNSAIEVDDPYFSRLPKGYITVAYFQDQACTVPATPSTGDVTLHVWLRGGQEPLELEDSPLPSTDVASFGSWAGPAIKFKATANAVAGAAYYKMTITANRG